MKIWGSATKIWGLNEKLGVSNDNLGVSNDKLGLSNEMIAHYLRMLGFKGEKVFQNPNCKSNMLNLFFIG